MTKLQQFSICYKISLYFLCALIYVGLLYFWYFIHAPVIYKSKRTDAGVLPHPSLGLEPCVSATRDITETGLQCTLERWKTRPQQKA